MQHINLCPFTGKTTDTPSLTPKGSNAYPITLETFYVDTTTKYWYKKYSDGWIEQGGYVDPQTMNAYSSRSVTFPAGREFVNKPIYLECQAYATGTGSGDIGLYGVREISNSGFTYTRGSATNYNNAGFYWVAKGL